MILNISNINKSFGDVNIIKSASFVVEDKEKVAIVGLNGAGKSTLLKIISGKLDADNGNISLSKDKKLAFLEQINNINSNLSIYEEMKLVVKHIFDMQDRLLNLSEEIKQASGKKLDGLYELYSKLNHSFELLEGYKIESKISGILNGLGFSKEDFSKDISTLSGGQKTRLFLAKILLEEPDIILLDEPTNHLDLFSIEWLETYLSNYKGAIVIVSHDRYFLNKIVTKVIDIDNGDVNTYLGNYTDFISKKQAIKESKLKAYEKQKDEIARQEAIITKLKSFNREKSIKRAESREKMLSKIDKLDKPIELKNDMELNFKTALISGKDVLSVNNLSKSFDKLTLFSDISFDIKRGEHIALIGENGSGKTTILKILNGILNADSGSLSFGSNVSLAYYDQEHQVLNENKNIFEEISDTYPEMNNTKIRNVLAAFLFNGDEVFKKISSLSGGERARVSLAKLMLSKANFLILDEPTNHLDIVSKEILENAIKNFTGTVFYVSHDRYFINQTATRILNLKNNSILNYIGNYDYYLSKRDTIENISFNKIQNIENKKIDNSESKKSWQENKEIQAKLKKKQRTLEKLENDISKLEEQISSIDEKFLNPDIQADVAKLISLQKEKEQFETELAKLYELWENLASE